MQICKIKYLRGDFLKTECVGKDGTNLFHTGVMRLAAQQYVYSQSKGSGEQDHHFKEAQKGMHARAVALLQKKSLQSSGDAGVFAGSSWKEPKKRGKGGQKTAKTGSKIPSASKKLSRNEFQLKKKQSVNRGYLACLNNKYTGLGAAMS